MNRRHPVRYSRNNISRFPSISLRLPLASSSSQSTVSRLCCNGYFDQYSSTYETSKVRSMFPERPNCHTDFVLNERPILFLCRWVPKPAEPNQHKSAIPTELSAQGATKALSTD